MKIIQTPHAPSAIGPYSQAVVVDRLCYCSGQIAIHPESGELLTGSVEDQTRQVLANLEAVLNAAGSGLDRVIRTTVFLRSMDDFPSMNTVYAQAFQNHKPARATVEVSRLPKDVAVEIDAIAYIDQTPTSSS